MNNEACQRYLEDPEGNAGHLADCEACRALFSQLDAEVPLRPIAVEALPLAPWEGARHRSWPLVVGGALAVFAITTGLFVAAGVSPASGAAAAMRVPLPGHLFELAGDVGTAMMYARGGVGGILLAGFVIVNLMLIALLRRSPRGVDASIR
jgi:hypothetical protein